MKRLFPLLGALTGTVLFSVPASAQIARPDAHITPTHLSTPSNPSIHTTSAIRLIVQPGDTLSGMMAPYGQSWEAVGAWNHLVDPNLIYPGQTLSVPPTGWVPPPAAIRAPEVAQSRPGPSVTVQAPQVASPAVHTTPQSYSPPPVTRTASSGVWGCIAEHESGNTDANTGNGFYGYFQFLPSTFTAVTGLRGLPSDYSYATQLAAAQKLQAQAGWDQWPQTSRICGA